MAIENVELMQECSSQHLHMETVRLKSNKETGKECKQKRVKMEKGLAIARAYRSNGRFLPKQWMNYL